MRASKIIVVTGTAAVLIAAAGPASAEGEFSVNPDAETTPVSHEGDAADDPAIWVHPDDPAKSAVVATDKQGNLEVYDLSGERIQQVEDSSNNVDVRGNLVIGADDEDGGHLRIYRIDPESRQLTALDSVQTAVKAHGVCMYDAGEGVYYAYPNDLEGGVEQWKITVDGDTVNAESVRTFDAGGAVEGCKADEQTGALYVGEEDAGVWRYGALPEDGEERKEVDTTDGNLVADVEGIAAAGKYLYVSSQGENRFTAYTRDSNEYLGKFEVASGDAADGCEDTDGIEASDAALGDNYPSGLFICHDGSNDDPAAGNQNFKFVKLDKITSELG